jgi:hypothetical protein
VGREKDPETRRIDELDGCEVDPQHWWRAQRRSGPIKSATTAVLFNTLEISPVPKKICIRPSAEGRDGSSRPIASRCSIATEATISSHKINKLGFVADANHSAGLSIPIATSASAPPTKAHDARTPSTSATTTAA